MTSWPVASAISCAAAWSAAWPRAQMATRAPSWDSPRATAFPMPLLPPVTSAIFPLRPRSMVSLREIALGQEELGDVVVDDRAGAVHREVRGDQATGAGKGPVAARDLPDDGTALQSIDSAGSHEPLTHRREAHRSRTPVGDGAPLLEGPVADDLDLRLEGGHGGAGI